MNSREKEFYAEITVKVKILSPSQPKARELSTAFSRKLRDREIFDSDLGITRVIGTKVELVRQVKRNIFEEQEAKNDND